MHTVELSGELKETTDEQVNDLISDAKAYIISNIPNDTYNSFESIEDEPRQISFIRSYWSKDNYFKAKYEKLANALIKLNYFYRLDLILNSKLIYNPYPEYIYDILKESVRQSERLCFLMSSYETEVEVKIGLVMIYTRDENIVFASNSETLIELVKKLIESEGLFIF